MQNDIAKNESRGKYILAAFLAPFIWGFIAIPVRWIQSYPAEDILYYRILSALLMLWLYVGIFRKKAIQQDINHFKSLSKSGRTKMLYLTFLASLFIFGNWGTYIYAINSISIQAAAFAYLICPLLTAILAYSIHKEQLTLRNKIGLVMASISVIMLASGSITDGLWSLTIALCYALYLITIRSIQGFDKLNSLMLQLTICSIFVLPNLLFNKHQVPVSPVFWGTISLIAILFTIIPLFLSMYALTKIASTKVAILLYFNPLITFVLAISYFGEMVKPEKYGAYLLIFLAILIFNSDKIKFKNN